MTMYKYALLLSLFLPLVFSATAGASESAYQIQLGYRADYFNNLQGGLKERDTYVDLLELTTEHDLQKSVGLDDSRLFAYAFVSQANSLSGPIVGDTQGVSNIDNSHMKRIMELWYEKNLEFSSVKFGLYDLNTEFDVIETAGLFLNSSHGIGPDFAQTGANGPSIYPTPSLALRFDQQQTEQYAWRVAVLDASSGDPEDEDRNTINLSTHDGALLVLENNLQVNQQRFGLGIWAYNRREGELLLDKQSRNHGVYFIAERFIPSENGRDLALFLRLGWSDQRINQIGKYIGTGVVVDMPFFSRPDDKLGLAIAHAINSSDFRTLAKQDGDNMEQAETSIELTYHAPINDHFSLQPDIQYIRNPGTDPTLDNALVVGIRFELTL